MKGTLILYLGANKMPSSIDQGSALFQNIPSSWRNKEVHYSLISDEFIPAPGEKGTVRLAPETVFFQVAQKPLYIPFSPGSLHFDWDSADSYGVVRGLGGGKVIDLRLIVTLEGKGSLPLRAEAKAEFWNPSMSHLILVKEAGISTEESDELVVLQPNHPTFIHCNIPLTSKDASFLENYNDFAVGLVFQYFDPNFKKAEKETFRSQLFPMQGKTLFAPAPGPQPSPGASTQTPPPPKPRLNHPKPGTASTSPVPSSEPQQAGELQPPPPLPDDQLKALTQRPGPLFYNFAVKGSPNNVGILDRSPCPHTMANFTSDAGTPLVVKPDGVCLDKIDLAYGCFSCSCQGRPGMARQANPDRG